MLVALPSAIAFGATIFASLGDSMAATGAMAGILGATALGLVAPAFGGSTRLITAPCAPAAAVLTALAIGFSQQGIPTPALLLMLALIAFLAGGLQIGLGLAGIGRLIRFIPFPVVSGYLSGVGLIIIGSQIPKLLGTPGGTKLLDALLNPSLWSWQSTVVGMVVIALMVFTPRMILAIPATILALLAGVVSYLLLALMDTTLLNLDHNPLLIGHLTSTEGGISDSLTRNLHAFRELKLENIIQVFVPALTLAVLLSIDTLKTCLVIDAMTNTHHDSDRELVGQGLGNMAASLIGGIPGAGTMGASLVNVVSGGKTRLSGIMTGVFSLVAFLLLAPVIAWLPVATLAAILIVIGWRMIDRHSLKFFFTKETRLDFFVILSVILVAIFGNLIAASGVGVALSILLFIREQTNSSVVHNRIEGHALSARLANLQQKITSDTLNEVVIFELQGSLFFGTANQLQAALEPETSTRKYVILSMRRVQSIDVTATHVLEQIKDRLEKNNAYLVFCDIPKDLPSGLKMKRYLKETGVVLPTNKAFAFRQIDEALEWIEAKTLENTPLTQGNDTALDLRQLPIFADCNDATLDALESSVTLQKVAAGKKVFKSGAPSNELLLLRTGIVKLTVPLHHKKESYHLATCHAGDIIDGMSFIESSHHSADALALVECEIYAMTRDQFATLASEHHYLGLAVYGHIARSLARRLHTAIGEYQALRG